MLIQTQELDISNFLFLVNEFWAFKAYIFSEQVEFLSIDIFRTTFSEEVKREGDNEIEDHC